MNFISDYEIPYYLHIRLVFHQWFHPILLECLLLSHKHHHRGRLVILRNLFQRSNIPVLYPVKPLEMLLMCHVSYNADFCTKILMQLYFYS